jgi:hypothetical protein
MPYRRRKGSVTRYVNAAATHETAAMTCGRLKDKLLAHGMPGWGDELPQWFSRDVSVLQLAMWESEGGSTAAMSVPASSFYHIVGAALALDRLARVTTPESSRHREGSTGPQPRSA